MIVPLISYSDQVFVYFPAIDYSSEIGYPDTKVTSQVPIPHEFRPAFNHSTYVAACYDFVLGVAQLSVRTDGIFEYCGMDGGPVVAQGNFSPVQAFLTYFAS